ncbi:MAG: hypothetical protein LBK58_03445 [Prevotellaceae bacterium]|jgi:hypothetical protein|nr:hypothetical protein [Prevotellaceae bacterium]
MKREKKISKNVDKEVFITDFGFRKRKKDLLSLQDCIPLKTWRNCPNVRKSLTVINVMDDVNISPKIVVFNL